MRASVLAGLGLTAVLALPAAAAGSTGPFLGQVVQGQTQSHLYNNNPSNDPCLQITATYTVTLRYVPSGDVLTLAAGTKTATGSNGAASLTFTRGYCTSFSISVTGTSVADAARYVVVVTRQPLGGLTA